MEGEIDSGKRVLSDNLRVEWVSTTDGNALNRGFLSVGGKHLM